MQFLIKTYSTLLIALTFSVFLSACKKLVEVDPPITNVSSSTVYTSDASAISAITGLYTRMSTGVTTGNTGISYLCGLSADDFTLFSGVTVTSANALYYRNQLNSVSPAAGAEFWSSIYPFIYWCNAAVEGLTASSTLTTAVKQQLLGEARFLRALNYFYLVNLYGDVPLILSPNYSDNIAMGRSPKAQVWQQIIIDLTAAQGLLSGSFLDGTLVKITTERVRPTNWAATALLARAYLYTGDYAKAEAQATTVINNSSLFGLVPFLNTTTTPVTQNDVFQKNSLEAIWQLQATIAGHNTEDAFLFQLPSTGPSTSNPVYLSSALLASFETGDQRRLNRNWVDSVKVGSSIYYFPSKYRYNTYPAVNGTYPSPSEYLMVLRLAEQYLIRAEARAQQNNISGAQSDLNMIRQRAGLPSTTALTQSALLTTILHERQVELFTEWGHRWLDLKRTGAIDSVMNTATRNKTANAVSWNTNQQLNPIPVNDILYNPNLVQTQGYP